jgi:nitroreductase
MMPPLTRRQFAIAAAGAAASLGSASARADGGAADLPTGGEAYRPWRDWRPDAAPVHAAILAANAHDTQPWQFCAGPDRIDMFADESRNLGAMDPFRREMHISLGCALENLALAARAQGSAADIAIDPGSVTPDAAEKGLRHAVRIALGKTAAEQSELFTAIPHRHTNRGTYNRDRPVSADLLDKLRGQAGADDGVRLVLLADEAQRRDFASATIAATQAIIADAQMIGDSDAWFRGTDAEIEKHRDGPTIYAAGLSPFRQFMAGILPAPSAEQNHDYWLSLTRDTQLATASAFGLIAVRDLYDRPQAIRAGRLWQRLHLQGTLLGLGMQPLNQLPEMVDRERQTGKPAATANTMAALAGDAEWHPTFAFRLGWPVRPAPASPRRPLEAVMARGACPA